MTKTSSRAYSRYNLEAIQLLGQMIKLGRIERKITAQDLATRIGISRPLLKRIEMAIHDAPLASLLRLRLL